MIFQQQWQQRQWFFWCISVHGAVASFRHTWLNQQLNHDHGGGGCTNGGAQRHMQEWHHSHYDPPRPVVLPLQVLSIGLGVGLAAVLGMLKFMYNLPLKALIAGSLVPTIGAACWMQW